jgi:hypothetical protein
LHQIEIVGLIQIRRNVLYLIQQVTVLQALLEMKTHNASKKAIVLKAMVEEMTTKVGPVIKTRTLYIVLTEIN